MGWNKIKGSGFSIAYTRRLDDHIGGMTFSNGVDNERTYDSDGRLTETNYRRSSSAPFSRAAYTLNSLGQRTSVERADGYGDTFGYDAKDQLTGIGYEVQAPASGGTALHAGSFAYDAMGNRTSADTGFDPVTTYTANNLNQYTSVSAFSAAPTYDADGNMTSVDGLDLTWDAENRLIQIEPVLAVNGDHRVQYAYDPLGRRVRKTVDVLQGGYWAEESDTHYTYWEWNVIEEHRDFPVAPSETRRLVWGEDLSGSFQGAGGVGGLLVQTVSGGSHNGADWFYHYDGNGNVTELTDGSGATVATYRYTAFGGTWSISGAAANDNQYRFSTKPLDSEVVSATSASFAFGLYYYGFRYYDPVTGRWPSRDPIGERGGLNLYGMAWNDTVNYWDFLGLTSTSPLGPLINTIGDPTNISLPNYDGPGPVPPGGRQGYWNETLTWTNTSLSSSGPSQDCSDCDDTWNEVIEEITSTERGAPFSSGGSDWVYEYADTERVEYTCRAGELSSYPPSGGRTHVHYQTFRREWFNGFQI